MRVVPEMRALIEFRRLNFMDCGLRPGRAAGNHLLPQRHYLFRPADPGAASPKADPATRARRVLFRGPFRVAARHGLAAGSGRTCRLSEVRDERGRLPDVDQCPTGRTLSGAQARRFCGRSSDRAWASLSGAGGWAPARCATASCPDARQLACRTFRRAIATSISAFDTWREQFDALGVRSKRTGSETIRRRGCAPDQRGSKRPATVGALNCQAALEVLEAGRI